MPLSRPVQNSQQRILELRQKAAQLQAEREAAAKAVESADKSNRASEKEAFKDIVNYTIDTTTPVGDIKAVYEWLQGDKNARTTLAAVLGVVGIKGGAKKADELVDAIATKVPPIVKYRAKAKQIESSLPPLKEGYTRLWRGNRVGEVGKNPSFTDDLPGIALPFSDFYRGPLSYVDVPTSRMDEFRRLPGGASTDAEFTLPEEFFGKARPITGELADLVEAQARDARAWMKQGGSKPLPGAIEEYARQGVLPVDKATQTPSFEALRPEAQGSRNTTGFLSRQPKPVTDEPAFKGATTDRTMTAHTQEQGNPQATAGLEPPGAPKMGDVYEDTGKYAANRLQHWDKGFDPEGFKDHIATALSAKTREAAKGKAGGAPEFWIYSEADKSLIVVKRDKDGALYVGKPKGRQPDVYERENGVIVKDPKGNPVLSDKIDMVVPKDAKGEVDRMVYELMMERLELK